MSYPRTRRETEERLDSLSEKSVDLVCQIDARNRHAMRVGFVSNLFGDTSPEMIFAVCTLDANGVGGGHGGGNTVGLGCRTGRYPIFRACGKGRRHALDGKAWSAAIAAVGEKAENSLVAQAVLVRGDWDLGWDVSLEPEDRDGIRLAVVVSPRSEMGGGPKPIRFPVVGELDKEFVRAYAIGQIFWELQSPEAEIAWKAIREWGRLIDALE